MAKFRLKRTRGGGIYVSVGRYEVALPKISFSELIRHLMKDTSLYKKVVDHYVKTYAGKIRFIMGFVSIETILKYGANLVETLGWFEHVNIRKENRNIIIELETFGENDNILAEFLKDLFTKTVEFLLKRHVQVRRCSLKTNNKFVYEVIIS